MPHNSVKNNVINNVVKKVNGSVDRRIKRVLEFVLRGSNMKKTISIRCKGAGELALHLLTPLQGELKSLSNEDFEKLRASILEYGFNAPVFVWECEEDANVYILDGHQRVRVLGKLQEEGYAIPQIPVVYVQADSLDHAKENLLTYVSQYGKVDKQGLYEFVSMAHIPFEKLVTHFDVPNLDTPKFIQEYYLEAPPKPVVPEVVNQETKPDMRVSSANTRQLQLFYDEATHAEVVEKVQYLCEKNGIDNISDMILELIREAHNRN